MKNAKSKYTHYVKDKMWTKTKNFKDVKKESDIVILNSKIDCLEALLARTTGGNHNSSSDTNSNNTNSARSGCKITAPKQGEPWTKTVNGKVFNFCEFHNFWTTQHKSNNCHNGLKLQKQLTQCGDPQLEINLATTENDWPHSFRVLFAPGLSLKDGTTVDISDVLDDDEIISNVATTDQNTHISTVNSVN